MQSCKLSDGLILSRVVSAAYSMLSKELLSKERFVPCSVRHSLDDRLNLVSVIVAIGVPFVVGPVLCPIIHLALTFCSFCCNSCIKQEHRDEEETRETW